jgi:hypothetical protein
MCKNTAHFGCAAALTVWGTEGGLKGVEGRKRKLDLRSMPGWWCGTPLWLPTETLGAMIPLAWGTEMH